MNTVYYKFVTVFLLFTASLTLVNSKTIVYGTDGQSSRNPRSVFELNVAANSQSWSDVVAETVLKSVVLFSTLNTENDPQFQAHIVNNSSIIVKGVSEFLSLYKRFIYDKLWTRKKLDDEIATSVTPVPQEIPSNPKEQIEIIGSKYHGRLCEGKDGCEITAIKTDDNLKEEVLVADEKEITECPPDTINVEGRCVSRMTQRFIMYVPKGCPSGYRKDRLGNCRPVFWSTQQW